MAAASRKNIYNSKPYESQFGNGINSKFKGGAKGTANAARVSRGSCHDIWPGLTVKTPTRDPSQHITVTCVIYNTIEGGVPTETDVMAAVKDMERLYESCGQGNYGHLADADFDFAKKETSVKTPSSPSSSSSSPPSSSSVVAPPIPQETATSAPPPSASVSTPSAPEFTVTACGSDDQPSTPSMEVFLSNIGLSEYLSSLISLGWDDVSFLRTWSLSEVRWIADQVGMKTGHAAKFVELGENSLNSFLGECGLSMYEQQLVELGWDNVRFLRTKSASELKTIADQASMKPGHVSKFIQLGETSVCAFLRERGLSMYNEKLVEMGWDDTFFCVQNLRRN